MKFELMRRTDLAFRALRTLADGKRRRAGDIAIAIGATPQYTARVMAALTAGGWVRSTRGPGGGYEATVDARSRSLRNLVEAIEGPVDEERCVLRPAVCGEKPCTLHEPWTRARAALLAELDHLSVFEVCTTEDST